MTRAFEIYNKMIKNSVKPWVVTYNALIDACGRVRNINLAYELFNQMIPSVLMKRGFRPLSMV